jgi:hypothetical protein
MVLVRTCSTSTRRRNTQCVRALSMVRRSRCRNLLQTTRRNVTSIFALNRREKSTKDMRRLLKKLVYLRVVPLFRPLSNK